MAIRVSVANRVKFFILSDNKQDNYESSGKRENIARIAVSKMRPVIQERLLVQSLDTEQSGWVPTSVLVKQQVQHYEREEMEVEQEFVMESAGGASEALYCREAIVRELVDTEEEFGRDLQAVVDRYVKPLDSPSVPRTVRDNKDLVFTNLKQITEFHNTVLIEGVKYYADEPRMLGKTFLRLERDFDKHVQYCRDEPIAQEFLQNNAEAREYFEERAQSLGDERSLSEHLKLPIQRIHDYQLLLKDLVKYSRKLGEDVTDLNKALELMLAIPHKASDNKYISNIEGYHGNIHKLGRLLRHDWFKVKFADTAKEKERYLFLFKARILICKVRKIAEDRSVFVLKHIIRLPEVEIKDDTSSELKFELCHKFPDTPDYPILLEAHKSKAKTEWLNEIRQYAADILALAEHAADDLRVQQESSTESKFGSLKGVELEISDDIVAEDIEQFTGNPLIEEQKRVKSQLKHVQVPERPPLEIPKKKAIFRFSDEDELLEDEIQCVAPEVERRIEAGELIVQEEYSRVVTQRSVRVEETGSVESKKVLQEITNTSSTKQSSTETTKAPSPSVETPIEPSLTSVPTAAKDRSPDTSAVERSLAAEKSPVVERSPVVDRSPVVERSPIPEDSTVVAEEQAEEDMDRYSMRSSGSRYRSVSSKVSEEVYVESSRTGGKTSASSSSRSFAMVEETVNGRTVRKEIMTSGTDSLGDNTDSARIKSYGRTDSVGSGCAIEEISSVRHLDGKTYDNNNEEIGIGGRTTRRGDYGEEITSTSSVRKSSKYSSSTGEEDTSSTRTKRYGLDETDSSSVRTKRASALDEEDSSATRTKRLADEDDRLTTRSALGLDEESTSVSRTRTSTSQYAREESTSGKRALDDEETERLTKKTVLDEDQTVRRTKVGISDVEAGEKEGPVFTKPLESYAVKVGEDATLECDVAASVLWLKNNKPIPLSYGDRYFPSSSSDQVHHTLHIMGVRESDEDSFTVRASNEDGAVSYCTTRLTVEHDHQEDSPDGSPKFLIGMKNTAVLEKTFLRFMVKVSGSPKPEVKFYKDDRFITSANQRVKIDKSRSSAGYYELILPQVTEEDAGQYKCIAMNEHGEAESEATLSVTDDKTIFYGLENSDLLKSGETPQFQWLRDGQPFQPEDRFKVDYKDEGDSLQLVFQNVKPEDAGLYTCVGTTSTGRLACSAELTIQGSVNQLAREPMAPKMSAESKTFESSLGSTAMMEFTCEGFPKPYLKLEKDGKEIETGGKCKFMYESDENVILAIKKLEPEDSGKYTVEAMNELGSSTQEFNLSIKAPPKYRNKLGDGEDVNIMVGQELKLSIGIDGIPKPEVKWLKDGKPVKETKDLVLSYDDSGVHTLTIEKATLKDSGSYSVTATNEMSTITDFTRVTVHAPPQFLRTMTKAVDCNIGDTITYQIKVEGDPLPDVKWMKDNEPLQIDEQHLKVTADGQVHSLIINKVKREDSGKYSALITNDHGSSQDDGRMNVRCAPLFTKKLEDFTALEGDQNVEFTVDIECYPKPVVKWFHDKTEITEKLSEFTKVEETDGHTYKLILSQVEREHAGKYICEVSNNLGKLKCDANFVVKAKPRFKKTLPETVEIDEGQSLSLSIEVEAVPEPEVKWYRNGQEITADANIKITRDSKRIEDYHLTVTLVKPEDGGEYEVRASNEVGSAVTKSRVLVHSVTKSKQADETEEGEAETKRLSNRQRKAGIYGFDSDDENEVDRKKSISNEKADDGEVIVTSRGKTTTKRKVTVTHDGVEKILEDSIVESSYGNDAERRQVKGPTVEEVEDETSPRVRKTSKRESYVREDSRQSVAEAEKVDVDFETRITGEVEVEAKVNDIEMKTRITGEVDVDNSNVNSRRTSRQASETEEPTCQQRRISKPGDDVRMVVEEGPVIEKPNATTPSDAKQKKRKWSITTAQVESYIPEESDNLDDEIYQTALGERLRRKFTKKDEDDNLKLTIYEITDGPTGEKSQKVKVSKDENLQHPRIDIYETKKPKISYSSSIDELDESDEEPAVAMDSTKLTRDGSSKDVKKKAYSHSRSVSREEASSRKTSRQSSKVESHKSSSSDDDGESVRTSRKTSRQSSRTEVTKRTESESILDSEGLDKDKIRSRQTSESETKQSRRASRQTSRHDETAKDGDDEAEVVSRKTSRQTSRRETKLSVNEEDVDSLRKTISPEPEDGEVIVTSRGKTTSKRKVTVTHDGVENVLEDSTVESSYGNDDRKRLLRGPTIEEGEDESVRKTSKIGDDEAEFLSRKTSRQSSRTEATREISVNEEDEDKDKKKDKIDAKEEVDDVDKLIEQIRAKRASILADDEEDRLTRRTSRQVSKEKTDEEIEQLLARKTSRQMSRNEEVRKIEESGEDDEVKPVEEMSVLERIRRKYSKATPEDDGDSLDLELEKYRPTSRLDDKYNRLISKQSSLVDDQQSRRASKAGDSGDDERTYSRRTSRLGEDEDDLTKVSSRRSSRLNDDELDRPASRRHSRLQDEEDVTKPSRGRLDDDGDKENDIYSRRGSRETSYSRHTSKDESLEIINPDDESGGKLPPASKYSVTDMKRRSSKLEKIADDEILQVTTSSRISKSQRAEVTTSDGSEVLSSRNSSRVDFADVEENGALPSKPSRRSSRSSVGDVSETPKVLSRQTSKLENVEEAESARISHVTSRSSTAELGETPKNLCRQESKVEEIETAKVSRRTSTTASGDLNETPKNLSRQTSKNEDVEEAQSARISRRTSRTSTAELNDSKLSRQTSKVEDVEEAQSAKIRLSSRTSTAELNESTPKNLSRQTSKLEEIEAESVKVSRRSSRASAVDQGGDTPRNLSRQTSKVEDVEEAQTARISRLTSRTSTADLCEAGDQLSRQTSKVEDIEEAQSAKISRRSSRADGDDTPKNLSRQTSKVERVEESQSSKVSRLNSRQSSTADVSETPKNLSRQTSKLGETDVEGKSSRTSRRSSRITGDETPRNLTRQNSIVETVEEPQKPILSRVNSQVSNAELSETPRNLSRRSSKLDKSESDNQEPKNFSRQESKLSRQSSTATENADKPKNLSRQSSILKTPKDSTEDDGSVPKNFSKSRQSSIIEDKAETKTLSRQSSKVDEKPSSLSRKSSRKSTTDAGGESLSRKSSRKTKPANRDSDEISETQSDKSKSAKSLSRQSSKLAESDEKGVPAQIIEEKMDARKVFETLSTVFEVIATGYPHPEAVWYKNGEVLEESERNVITNEGKSYKLEIVRTTHSDAGEYSVVVKNRLGEASSKGSLEIADVKGLRSPRIKTPLESLIIHKYEKAQFTAVVIAFPEPDIKWTIAGKDPQPVVEYIVDTKELDYGLLECTFTLLIPNGHHCHTGDVLFVASNDYGSCETGARLDVLLRPEIQALKDLTCEPYQTTAFEVEIDANPKPRVTWSFKGEKITGTDPRVQVTSEPDQDMYRLTIRNVGLGDEGVYEVEASNNLGVASAIARLKVHRPGDGAEDEDGLDSKRVKPGSLGSGDTGKPQQGRKADGKGLADEDDLDSRRHKPGSLDSEAGGKPHKGRKAYGSDSADEDEGLDSRGVKPRTLDSDASGKPQQGRKADGSGLADENDLDSRRHKPGSLDSEASGKPERAGKADGRDSADEDEGLDSRGNKPRTVDSDAGGKPQRGGKADGKSLADEDDLDSRRGKPRTLDSDDEDRPHHARRADGKGLAYENDLDSRGVKPRTLDSDAAGKPQQGRKTDGKGLEDENDLDSRRHKPSTLDSDDDDKPQRGRKDHGGDSANENDLDSRRGQPWSLDSDASDKPQRGGKADGRGIADENDLDSRRLKLGSLDSEASGKPTGKSGVKSDEDDEGTVSFTVARKRGKPETAGSKDGADSGRGDSKVTLARPYGARSESDQADQHDTGKPETAGSIPLDAEAKKPEVDESSAGKTKTIEPEGQMPAFIKRLDEQTVREYAPLEAKVRADGIPKPVLKWLKNGDIINEEDDDRIRIETTKEGVVTSTLYISHFAPEHVAKYTVIAANLVGEVECFARFRMADHPPMFTRPLNRSLEVQEGHPIELRAQLEASPLAQLRWTKNGEKLLPSDRIEMSSTPDGAVKLSIHEAQLSDSGAYKLFAFNDNGEMHSMCAVVVDPEDKIPSIAQPLSEVLGYEGEPLKLTALIEGFPIPTITWMKDSHILHSGSGCSMVTKPSACGNYTEVSLILPNPGPKDAGRYSFVAQNKLGDAESATRVEIARKETIPRFSLQLNPGKVIEGYPAKLAVKAYAYPEPELQWTFNNHPFIPDGIHSRIITDDDGTQTLLIDKTLPDDAGVYAVMATNNRGTASTRGILDVQPSGRVDQEEQAPGFVHNFKDLTVDEDTPIDFSAPFVGNPIPQVEWFKDGIPLIPSKRLQFTCDGLKVGLNIAKAEPVDAGKYTCTLENKHGKASSSGEIQVRKLYQAPHFLQKFTDQQQRDAKFLARVTGVPTPTVQWYRDGVAIESDDKYRIKRDDEMVCLYVRRCSLDDEAEYKVVAKNREGEVSCEARLKVVDQLEKQEKIEPPSFLKRIGDIEVYPGMSAKFTACMTGYPVPSVEWYKNGEPLEASDKVQIDTESSGILRLTIHRTDLEEDAAIYKCRIWNPHGEATCDAKLLFETLEIRPKAPVGELYSDYDRIRSTGIPLPLADKPIISRMTDRRLTLSWKPSIPYGARYPVTYHVEMCDLPDGDWFTVRMGKIIVKNIPYVLYLVTYYVQMCDLPDGDWFTVPMGT
ncbi:hypothetical protein M8J76_005116 [Diaphorina citri]|nr:hypothetical protein M8J76_005116 [Diaphorina citri]